MKYQKTIIDEASGIEVPNPRYGAYMDGIREVVGFLADNEFIIWLTDEQEVLWRCKLKEWDIEDVES